MLLKEFINLTKSNLELHRDSIYLSQNDSTVLKKTDTRKSRLTLKMINEIRKASEVHDKEKKEELGLVRKMYAIPAQPAQ